MNILIFLIKEDGIVPIKSLEEAKPYAGKVKVALSLSMIPKGEGNPHICTDTSVDVLVKEKFFFEGMTVIVLPSKDGLEKVQREPTEETIVVIPLE